jgi:hypothetical protein
MVVAVEAAVEVARHSGSHYQAAHRDEKAAEVVGRRANPRMLAGLVAAHKDEEAGVVVVVRSLDSGILAEPVAGCVSREHIQADWDMAVLSRELAEVECPALAAALA